MSKIKVVQMLLDKSGDLMLLDNKGRIWYQSATGKWYEYDLNDLPEEPTKATTAVTGMASTGSGAGKGKR
jgi:hypothetical protein